MGRGHGQRRLRDVGGDDDLALPRATAAKDCILVLPCDLRVQQDEQELAAAAVSWSAGAVPTTAVVVVVLLLLLLLRAVGLESAVQRLDFAVAGEED